MANKNIKMKHILMSEPHLSKTTNQWSEMTTGFGIL